MDVLSTQPSIQVFINDSEKSEEKAPNAKNEKPRRKRPTRNRVNRNQAVNVQNNNDKKPKDAGNLKKTKYPSCVLSEGKEKNNTGKVASEDVKSMNESKQPEEKASNVANKNEKPKRKWPARNRTNRSHAVDAENNNDKQAKDAGSLKKTKYPSCVLPEEKEKKKTGRMASEDVKSINGSKKSEEKAPNVANKNGKPKRKWPTRNRLNRKQVAQNDNDKQAKDAGNLKKVKTDDATAHKKNASALGDKMKKLKISE